MVPARHTDSGLLVLEGANNHQDNAEIYLSLKHTDEEGRYTLLYHRDQFYSWTGSHWETLAEEDVEESIARVFRRAVVEKIVDDHGTETITLVNYLPSTTKLRELMKFVKLRVLVNRKIDPPSWLDEDHRPDLSPPADPHDVVATTNVLINTRTLETYPHTPLFFNQFAAGYAYDPQAPEPGLWLRFLSDTWGEDAESIGLLQEYFGYLLTTRTDLQKMLILIGLPRSGKGTIIRTLTAMLGGSVGSVSLADLNQRFGLAEIADKQVAIMQDARFRAKDDGIAVERLLSITGEDPVSVDIKNKSIYTGKLPTRFVLVSNEIPQLRDESGALQTRMLMLRIRGEGVPEERRDPDLGAKLRGELPGILNWALEGLARLNARGRFQQPASSAEDTKFMTVLSSPTIGFVEVAGVLGEGRTVPKRDLYRVYTQWSSEVGLLRVSENVFARNLYAAAPNVRSVRTREVDPWTGGRMHVYTGITLSTEGEKILARCPMEWLPKGDPGATTREDIGLPPI